MIQIIPAILPQTFADIRTAAQKIAGHAPRAQIDIVDGVFAPNKTWPYVNDDRDFIFEKLSKEDMGLPEWSRLEYELDMMIEKPADVYEAWISAGISTLIPHLESAPEAELAHIMKGARARGVGFGIAVLPTTPTSAIERWFNDADFIQVMGSPTIGRQGTPLEEVALDRIRDIKRVHPACVIAIDIGVNTETIPTLIGVGVTKFVAGSAIWKSDDPISALKALQSLGGA